MNTHILQKNKGFTFIEIILVIALIGITAGISVPVYQSFQTRNDLEVSSTTIVQTLRRAQLLSQAMDGDTSWGVNVAIGNITLFKGESFSSRNIEFDEIFSMPTSISVSGLSEIVFEKFTGEAQNIGTTTLTSINNETRSINITSKGTVSY
ncbi:type II secretion system protein [Candidatus Wolfebacteria bacterium]|nr:type II secretion system protein [Candidatus Wolfebacteria bacterium]